MAADTMTAWVLNLDAEAELAVHPRPYQPTAAMRARIEALSADPPSCVRPGDVLIGCDGATMSSRGTPLARPTRGIAWCPTPSALRRMRAAGLEPATAPPPTAEVLRRVNARDFALGIEPGPLGADFVDSIDALRAYLRAHAAGPRGFLLKRALSFAGRGQRRVHATLADADVAWCAAGLRDGLGLLVEPRVQRLADFAQHGYVEPDGTLHLGAPTRQHCDDRGCWHGSAPASLGELDATQHATLRAMAERCAAALCDAGYHGPFGIDAFIYADDAGMPRLHPLVELNARFTMGYGVSGAPIAIAPD